MWYYGCLISKIRSRFLNFGILRVCKCVEILNVKRSRVVWDLLKHKTIAKTATGLASISLVILMKDFGALPTVLC